MSDLKPRPRSWRRWQAAAGPWRGWVVCPALSMPSPVEPARGEPLPDIEVPELARSLQGDGTAVVIDLEPVLGLAIAADLSHRQLAHVVLVLPRWPHLDAVLPCDEFVCQLVEAAGSLKAAKAQNVVFVLDGERQKPVRRRTNDWRVDNRYALAPGDLPAPGVLRRAGIQRIVKITRAT